jgi:uncharacterized protein
MADELTISVSDVDAGGKPFDFVIRSAWVRGALEDCEATSAGTDGRFAGRVSKSAADFVLHGHLSMELQVPCGRCLEPTHFNVDEDLSLLFVPARELKKKEHPELEITAEDADTYPYEGETLVLDDIVRDELVLETPMIPLCSEDCAGIRPAGEASSGPHKTDERRPIDPRLAPLLRFRTNSKE